MGAKNAILPKILITQCANFLSSTNILATYGTPRTYTYMYLLLGIVSPSMNY
jgi:hypothetical protein